MFFSLQSFTKIEITRVMVRHSIKENSHFFVSLSIFAQQIRGTIRHRLQICATLLTCLLVRTLVAQVMMRRLVYDVVCIVDELVFGYQRILIAIGWTHVGVGNLVYFIDVARILIYNFV